MGNQKWKRIAMAISSERKVLSESCWLPLQVKQYSQNIAKGKEIIDFFIKQLRDEGIESVPQFQVIVEPNKYPIQLAKTRLKN